jgi:long-chain fatty acid transport protein
VAVPTLGAAYAIAPGVRLGASVGWGLAWVKTSAAGAGLRQPGIRPADDDLAVTVVAKDLFVPRATGGVHVAVAPWLELGAAVTWSAPIDARGDARTEAGAFSARAASGDGSKIAHGDTSVRDCGQPGTTACGDGGNARLTIPVPLEASAGVRLRIPRARGAGSAAGRDPRETELADVELDATFAGDSAIDRIGLQFPGDAGGGTIPVPGTAGELPPDASASRRYRDVFGARLGGDVVVIPGVLSLRAGSFVETRAGAPGEVGLEALPGARVGVALGATARIHDARGGAFDVTLGFLHVFVSDVAETDPRRDGVRAISGTRCGAGAAAGAGGVCPDGGPAYRTRWPVGLGTLSGALDVIHAGVAYRF